VTTPSDPIPPGDGSYGLPSAPPPSEAEAHQQVLPAPTEIVIAFWAYVVGAVVGVIGGIMLLGAKQSLIDSLRASNTNGALTDTQIQSAAGVAVTVGIVVSIIVAALYVFFAFKLKAGRNWARIVLLIIAVLALLNILTGRGTALSYIGEVAAVVGAVASFLPKSSAYISAVKRNR
jgi:hypothetical protein